MESHVGKGKESKFDIELDRTSGKSILISPPELLLIIMANVVVRLSIYSEEINADINKFIESLPKPDSSSYLGEVRKLANGTNSPAMQEHSIDYEYRYDDILDIEIINKDFYIKWMPFINVLKDIVTNHKFSLSLNYEITVYDYEYPSLYFQPSYLAFLGEISAVLSFYYYND